MKKTDKIFVAGHKGMVGSAIVRALRKNGYNNIITRSRKELDLTIQADVRDFFQNEKIDLVFLAAAKVGGIHANNSFPADFINNNLLIQANVIDSAYRFNTRKLLFLGSSCIYPRDAAQPLKEEYLLTGPLEPTNEWYAVAKIAGIKLCQAYQKQYGFNAISLMPTNLYGPGDNFNLESSHVLPALIRKFHEAKIGNKKDVEIWGTGTALREFLHVDDLANSALFLMENYSEPEIINVGTGKEITIGELAKLVKDIVGFTGELRFNTEMPDGTPRKLLDVSQLSSLGWRHKIKLKQGIQETYEWFLAHEGTVRD